MIDHPALDTLHRMLCLHQLRAAFFANPTLCDQWQLRFEGEHRLTFHLVQAGRCVLQLDDTSPVSIQLNAGDLAVIPQHRAHVLNSRTHSEDDVGSVALLCGAIDIEREDRSLLLEALPASIVIGGQDAREHPSLRRLLELLTAETADDEHACQLVLDKLAEALFAMVLRHYVCTDRPHHGLFARLERFALAACLGSSACQRREALVAARARNPGDDVAQQLRGSLQRHVRRVVSRLSDGMAYEPRIRHAARRAALGRPNR